MVSASLRAVAVAAGGGSSGKMKASGGAPECGPSASASGSACASAPASTSAGGPPADVGLGRTFECGRCEACLDKIKYGGPGRLRKACYRRPGKARPRSSRSSHEGAHMSGMERARPAKEARLAEPVAPAASSTTRCGLRGHALPTGGHGALLLRVQPSGGSFLDEAEIKYTCAKGRHAHMPSRACAPPPPSATRGAARGAARCAARPLALRARPGPCPLTSYPDGARAQCGGSALPGGRATGDGTIR